MATTGKTKVLRIGIIQGGKIVEERVLRKREDVSIGAAPRNTFILPVAHLPKSYTLFEARANGYALVFDGSMEGRVSVGSDIVDLKALSKSGKAEKRGNLTILALDERARGKVVIGDTTLLFQFVDAPPVVAQPPLPAATRQRMSSRIDWTFTYILLISMLLQGGTGVGLDVWWRQTGRYLQDQWKKRGNRAYEVLKAEVLREKEQDEIKEPDEPKDEPEVPTEVAEAPPQPEPEPEPQKRPEKKKVAKPAEPDGAQGEKKKLTRDSARFKEVASNVRKKTFLHVLGSDGGDGDDGMNTLTGGVASAKLDDAFNLDGGVAFADKEAGQAGGYAPKAVEKSDGERYKKLTGDDAGGRIATKTVKTESKEKSGKEVAVRVNIRDSLSSPTGTGTIDKSSVASVFSRRKGAIKACYESALKTNPNIKGKVSIKFVIGTAGRVTSVNVVENTTGDGSIGSCISGKVKSWKFPPASGGAVTFSHTFVLSSS